ncbi:fructose-1,6-bisphosphatase class 1/Sedoheputulose-1,7-bisphosphatase [Ochromonadaceae sp. CCMP2298]|nr:fructose-1,6-bisphosphatase class 1/Sedoheputulose-1,7-bisphosphatase [Ochromonadaceae sp. CCMP2298]
MATESSGDLMTLSRFMVEATRANPDHADFVSLIQSIQIACKAISHSLKRHSVTDLVGTDASSKASLYDTANTILQNSLRFTGKIGKLAGEQPILIEEAWNSKYIAVFDPLDGSSNIDVGIVTGTIFGIFKEDEECLTDFGEEVKDEETMDLLLRNLKPSKNLVAAGYCMYSSATVMMLSIGDGVHGFTLDPTIGEFVLTHLNVKIPPRGRTYSFNEARAPWWPPGLSNYVEKLKRGEGESQQSYTSRYIGSMVGDVHRTLLYGGVFGYPGDSKSAPQGKLRLLHEAAPMAFLVEQAGGKASTGSGRLLDTQPKSLHDHVPTILGGVEDVGECERALAGG